MNDSELLEWYQEKTAETAIYPKGEAGLAYVALKLSGEIGELWGALTDRALNIEAAALEFGDVCWYISQLFTELNNYEEDEQLKVSLSSLLVEGESIKETAKAHKQNYINMVSSSPYNIDFICLINLSRASLDANEIIGKFIRRGFFNPGDTNRVRALVDEVWGNVNVLADYLNLDIKEILSNNIEKLTTRKEAGELKDRDPKEAPPIS